MIDEDMETHQILNRLVARHVLGWRIVDEHTGNPFDGGVARAYHRMCSNPWAWSKLMHMMSNNGSVSLSFVKDQNIWIATVHREPSIFIGRSKQESPGKALVIAVLRSYGVEDIDQYEDVR